LRQRRGVTPDAQQRRARRGYFGAMMVEEGAADGLVTGLTQPVPRGDSPPLEVIRTRPGRRAGGVYLVQRNDFKFFADCT
jgi:malate dehydrogenase (oxaloacetate-decarboxylating)(NADP+)